MYYRHTFIVQAPLDAVAAFHQKAASMAAITPPPLVVQIHQAPELLDEGAEMVFSLWFGPLPLRWRARIEDCTLQGFRDRQISGPFQSWSHQHTFASISPQATQVIDEVHAELKRQLAGWLAGGLMWIGMPLLFAYRGWQTSRLLERRA